MSMSLDLESRLVRIEAALQTLLHRHSVKDAYSTHEFAAIVGRSEFTVREWARLGRIQAAKKRSGRGKHFSWVMAHEELIRFQKEGLLPFRKHVADH